MESKFNYALLYNPFSKIAGWKATVWGLILLLLTTVIGNFSNVVMNGALDVHLVAETTIWYAFGSMAVGIACLVAIMWVAGWIIAPGFRFIDMLGTLLLAKAPLLIVAVAGFATHMPDPAVLMQNPSVLFNSMSLLVVLLIIIPVSIWNIALTWHAFVTTTGAKGRKLVIAFIAGLIVAEIISFSLIQFIFN